MSDSEYTPSTEDVENGYAHDPEAEYRDPVNYGYAVAGNRRAFRRWLAAHDAVIREDERVKNQVEYDRFRRLLWIIAMRSGGAFAVSDAELKEAPHLPGIEISQEMAVTVVRGQSFTGTGSAFHRLRDLMDEVGENDG